jgi:hypothetical protein
VSNLIITIVGGVAVLIIAACLGIGGTKYVVIHGSSVKKTGKWMMIMAVLIIFGGLHLASLNSTEQAGGWAIAILGLMFFGLGKFIAWFQRP